MKKILCSTVLLSFLWNVPVVMRGAVISKKRSLFESLKKRIPVPVASAEEEFAQAQRQNEKIKDKTSLLLTKVSSPLPESKPLQQSSPQAKPNGSVSVVVTKNNAIVSQKNLPQKKVTIDMQPKLDKDIQITGWDKNLSPEQKDRLEKWQSSVAHNENGLALLPGAYLGEAQPLLDQFSAETQFESSPDDPQNTTVIQQYVGNGKRFAHTASLLEALDQERAIASSLADRSNEQDQRDYFISCKEAYDRAIDYLSQSVDKVLPSQEAIKNKDFVPIQKPVQPIKAVNKVQTTAMNIQLQGDASAVQASLKSTLATIASFKQIAVGHKTLMNYYTDQLSLVRDKALNISETRYDQLSPTVLYDYQASIDELPQLYTKVQRDAVEAKNLYKQMNAQYQHVTDILSKKIGDLYIKYGTSLDDATIANSLSRLTMLHNNAVQAQEEIKHSLSLYSTLSDDSILLHKNFLEELQNKTKVDPFLTMKKKFVKELLKKFINRNKKGKPAMSLDCVQFDYLFISFQGRLNALGQEVDAIVNAIDDLDEKVYIAIIQELKARMQVVFKKLGLLFTEGAAAQPSTGMPLSVCVLTATRMDGLFDAINNLTKILTIAKRNLNWKEQRALFYQANAKKTSNPA